jgi:hypothetical protein
VYENVDSVLGHFDISSTAPINGAVILLYYSEPSLGGVDESQMHLAFWNGGAMNWQSPTRTGTNTVLNRIWAATTHLSAWSDGCGSDDCDDDGISNEIEVHGLAALEDDLEASQTLTDRDWSVNEVDGNSNSGDGGTIGRTTSNGNSGSGSVEMMSQGDGDAAYADMPDLELDFERNYYVSLYFNLPKPGGSWNHHWFHVLTNRHVMTVIDSNQGSSIGNSFTVREASGDVSVRNLDDPTHWYHIEYWIKPRLAEFELAIDDTKYGPYDFHGEEIHDEISFRIGDDSQDSDSHDHGEAFWDDVLIRQAIDLDNNGVNDADKSIKDVFIEVDSMATEKLFVQSSRICDVEGHNIYDVLGPRDGKYASGGEKEDYPPTGITPDGGQPVAVEDSTHTETPQKDDTDSGDGERKNDPTIVHVCSNDARESWEFGMENTELTTSEIRDLRTLVVYLKHFKSRPFRTGQQMKFEIYDGRYWHTLETWSSSNLPPSSPSTDYPDEYVIDSYIDSESKLNATKFRLRNPTKEEWASTWYVDSIMITDALLMRSVMKSKVVDAFKNNPTELIKMHIDDADDDEDIDYIECPYWKNSGTSDFLDVKGDHFASNRQGVFHYALLTDRYSIGAFHCIDSSGQAEIDATNKLDDGFDNFLVAYGIVRQAVDNSFRGCGRHGTTHYVTAYAGTFMHELGHNFDLHHYGDKDQACNSDTPRYKSIMTYDYQFIGVVANPSDTTKIGPVDYSDGTSHAKDYDDWGNLDLTRVSA